ncbi:MAG TPA: F0F1 ATP synthase subunit C [Acidimicrobiia bacterium]|nr:F0F1 ATP synthase subunit C [Acidimicrobiia bacterium]
MDAQTIIALGSVITAGLTVAIGASAAAIGEARALDRGLASLAQQPDEAGGITRTLFVGLAFIESSGIYCFVISLILIFANPFVDLLAGG